jgi:hypothetical protein
VYEIIVMDNDLSMENILKWIFTDAFEAGLIDEIPKTAGGSKRVDNGKLPLTHLPILRLANHNNRNRYMAGKCYNLVWLPKKKSICTIRCSSFKVQHELCATLVQGT